MNLARHVFTVSKPTTAKAAISRNDIPMKVAVMSNDEIKTIVEGAFKPLRCEAEICDYEAELKFKVYDLQYYRLQGFSASSRSF